MTPAAPNYFTAAQLARAAGVSKRALLARLKAPSRATVIVNGNEARAWALEDLPETVRAKIQIASHGLALETFVSSAPEVWQLRDTISDRVIPLSEIADAAITKAGKLRRALERALELVDNPVVSEGEAVAAGLEDYRAMFGYSITDRHLRGLLKRTVDRDRGFENWNRLEIYLDGNPLRKVAPVATAIAPFAALQFQTLHNILAGFKSATVPAPREREALWAEAIKILRRETDAGGEEKPLRIALVNFLWRSAPWLSRSKNALRVTLRNYVERSEAGKPFRDGRHAKRGIPTKPIPEAQRLAVVGHTAFNCGFRVSQGYREMVKEWEDGLGVENELAEILAGAQAGQTPPPMAAKKTVPRLDAARSLKASPAARDMVPPVVRENRMDLFAEAKP